MTSFLAFCEILEKVSRISSKNEKVRILSEYLSALNPDEISAVCRFLSGKESQSGMIGVGFSIILDSLNNIMNVEQDEISKLYLKYGDLGDAVKELLEIKERPRALVGRSLELIEVRDAMDQMAEAKGKGSTELKKKILSGLLLRSEPLEAKYLIRIITNELRIGATEGILLDSLSSAFGVKNLREWYLVLGDIGEVALRLARGERSIPPPMLFRPVSFMLALPVQDENEAWEHFGKQVFAEYKYDGIRLQAHVSNKSVRLFSRRMEDITESMPEIVESLSSIEEDCIFDGEAVACRDGKPEPFTLLQRRLHRKNLDSSILMNIPLAYFVFDIIKLNEQNLLYRTLAERKNILDTIKLKGAVKKAETFSVSSAEEIGQLFRKSRELGYEGLVLKDPDSIYTPGRRGGAWIKMKEELDTLDVVVIKAEYGNGKRAGLLSDLTFGVWDKDHLVPIGKAYSGLTDEEIKSMTELLKSITIERTWNGVIVEPKVVLEVAFDSIQRSERHGSGYALRFPRIKRIRWDKGPYDADRLERVEQIYRSQILKEEI